MNNYHIDCSMNDAPYQGIHIFKDNEHIITFWEDDAPVHDFNYLQRQRATSLVHYLNQDELVHVSPEVVLDCFEHARFIKPHERIKL